MEGEQNINSTDRRFGRVFTPPRPAPFLIFPYEPLPPNLLTQINNDLSEGYYGPFDADLLAVRAASFIRSNSRDANEGLLTQVMREFLVLAREDCITAGRVPSITTTTTTTTTATGEGESNTGIYHGKAQHVAHSCWLCIHMTLPTDEWAVPRWHRDGRMFQCTCPEQSKEVPPPPHSKYAFTILGPSMRVMIPNPSVKAVMGMRSEETGRSRWNQNSPDPELAKRLAEYPEAEVQPGQVIQFS